MCGFASAKLAFLIHWRAFVLGSWCEATSPSSLCCTLHGRVGDEARDHIDWFAWGVRWRVLGHSWGNKSTHAVSWALMMHHEQLLMRNHEYENVLSFFAHCSQLSLLALWRANGHKYLRCTHMRTWWTLLLGKTLQMPAHAWKSFVLLHKT